MRKLLLFLIVLLCAGVARQARATDSMTLSALSPASNATNQPDGSAAYPLTISMTITGSSSIDNAFSPPVIGTNILLSSTACTSPTSVTATGSVSYSSCSGIPSHCKVASVSMSPSSTLSGNTKYYICVLNGSAYINDTGGTKLASSSTYFTTRDNTPPTVSTWSLSGVPISSNLTPTLTITFSENLLASSVNTTNVLLHDDTAGSYVTISPSLSGAVISLSPTLTDGHTYTLTAKGGAGGLKDSSSNALAADWNSTWVVDHTQPTVSAISPDPVLIPYTPYINVNNPTVSATFSESIVSSTLTTTSFTLKKNNTGSTVATGVTYNSASTTGTLTIPPLSDGSYTASLTNTILDLAATGNALVPRSWTFIVDTVAPVVASYTPANGAVNVAPTTSLVVTFTELNGMLATSMNSFTVTVNDGTKNVPVLLDTSVNNQLTIKAPAGGFDYSTLYTVTLSSGVTDKAGNSIPTTSWTFTTQTKSLTGYEAYPPFMCSTVMPNVLIVLDNSNSMDEDLNNNAVGSPMCTNSNDPNTCSKSILARQVLTNIVNTFSGQMNIGIMSYKVTGAAQKYLHNMFYFNSYDPKSYCPTPPTDGSCYNYCVNEDPKVGVYAPSAYENACNAACTSTPAGASFVANYRSDSILTTAGTAQGSDRRKTFCTNIYPKTQKYIASVGATQVPVYYGPMVGTFYAPSAYTSAQFCYSNPYVTTNAGTNALTCDTAFSGAKDTTGPTGFSGTQTGFGALVATDDDLALGFDNYGARSFFYYTSPTYYSSDQPGTGYINVPIAAPSATQKANLLAVLGGNLTNVGFQNDPTDYMACTSSNQNPYYATGSTSVPSGTCRYILNAGLTPTSGVFLSASQYFSGTLNQAPAPNAVIPAPISTSAPCQKNFIIYITDGSPSLSAPPSPTFGAASTLMPDVVTKIDGLRCPTLSPLTSAADQCKVSLTSGSVTNYFDVQTYVLGVGLLPPDKSNVDQMAVAGGTAIGGHAYYADNANGFTNSLYGIFQNIISQISSGTAASILNNSQGSGANLLQAVFYPTKDFDSSSSVQWIGEMQNLWYFVDPKMQSSNIREDSNQDNILTKSKDKIVQFYFDTSKNITMVNRYADTNGDGYADSTTPVDTVTPDQVNSIWKAGRLLWNRDLSADPRLVFTGYKSSRGFTPQKFSSTLADGFVGDPNVWDMLQVASSTNPLRQAKAATLINFMLGSDQPADADGTMYRSRRVTINGCGLGNCTREWRLGDIVSSTPKLVSNLPLGAYDKPSSNSAGYNDNTYAQFVNSTVYKTRGMAFVGANDGMLHAFKLGTLKELTSTDSLAELTDTSGALATASTTLGREEWSFIPTNVLPYLGYYANPSYDHIFSVDRTPTLVDASIGVPAGCSGDYSACTKSLDGSTWRTVLIGGMGYGGATRNSTGACGVITGVTSPTCILTPKDGAGLSSYFALDVTDPENPKYLWEFSGDPSGSGNMGASTTGPALVRVTHRNPDGSPDATKNGKWFAVFASGPTGPIDTIGHRFLGESDQSLKIFIVDLATGTLLKTIDAGTTLGITNAFAGTLTTNVIDTDHYNSASKGFYSDDVVYIGYTQLDTTTNTWTKGGVIRLTTGETDDPTSTVPGKMWKVSSLISGTGPVTSAITKLQDRMVNSSGVQNHDLWIYFATGRFFYKGDDPTTGTQQQLYGVREPCYSTSNRNMQTPIAGGTNDAFDPSCTDSVSGTLVDQSGTALVAPSATLPAGSPGWVIKLDAASGNSLSERVISDSLATTSGAVFFTTFKPSSLPCDYGGGAYIWSVGYNSGAAPPSAAMKGQMLLQVSTGAFAQMSMATAFTNVGNARLNLRRTTTAVTGVPPIAQGLSLIVSPSPVKKIIQIREK